MLYKYINPKSKVFNIAGLDPLPKVKSEEPKQSLHVFIARLKWERTEIISVSKITFRRVIIS